MRTQTNPSSFLLNLIIEKKEKILSRNCVLTRSFMKIEYDVIYQFIETCIQETNKIDDKDAQDFFNYITDKSNEIKEIIKDFDNLNKIYIMAWLSFLNTLIRYKITKHNLNETFKEIINVEYESSQHLKNVIIDTLEYFIQNFYIYEKTFIDFKLNINLIYKNKIKNLNLSNKNSFLCYKYLCLCIMWLFWMENIEHKQENNIIKKYILENNVLQDESYIKLLPQSFEIKKTIQLFTEEDLCSICLENKNSNSVFSLFLPCNHYCCC